MEWDTGFSSQGTSASFSIFENQGLSIFIPLGLPVQLPQCPGMLLSAALVVSVRPMIWGDLGGHTDKYRPRHVPSIRVEVRVTRIPDSGLHDRRGMDCWSWRGPHTMESDLSLPVNGRPAHLVQWSENKCLLGNACLVSQSRLRPFHSRSLRTLHWSFTNII